MIRRHHRILIICYSILFVWFLLSASVIDMPLWLFLGIMALGVFVFISGMLAGAKIWKHQTEGKE